MIGFLKPADSRPVRVWACVGASGSGPTKTRKIPSFGAGASTTWNPFLPSASAMISASGRPPAPPCQYWPPDGSPAAAACTGGPATGGGAGDGLGLVSWTRAGAVFAGAGLLLSGGVAGGLASFVAGAVESAAAGVDGPFDDESGVEPLESASASGLGFSLRARSAVGDELRPTM